MKQIIFSLIAALALTGSVWASPEKGLEIAKESVKRDNGFQDQSSEMEMILKNSQGQTSTRFMRSKTLETGTDGDKLLIVFDQPRDVKGTAFLTFTHNEGPDDQWLYLPALKRVKRISSSNKSGPFMGSEFAYEDLTSNEVEKYKDYNYIGDEACGDTTCYVIERVPVDKNSGYTKQVVWVDQEHYRSMKVDYYDRKGSLLKTLTFKKYKQYVGKYWRADEMFMENHQSGKSTVLNFKNYELQAGLSDKDFNRNALKRIR